MRPPRIFASALFVVVVTGLLYWFANRTTAPAKPAATAVITSTSGRTDSVSSKPVAPAAASVPAVPVSVLSVGAAQPTAPVEVVAQAAVVPIAQSTPVEAAVSPRSSAEEVVATENMYLAHATLRTREVADPDSETNRRILQTMVTKALAATDHAPATN